ncbi:protein kinase domain-containing protein [Tepidimicrobium xylanilyticum]|uniref:non-specific serine/threonine protein kinase n=1 Tax=Tepidimicrobium xylanilyticum TaxID=1123352 RepID=A0A1H2XRW4_9FIRM|nr:AarF/UbiB family protein [Tepidimicrobium xylanilyticum]GMG97572.1 hypothetical protein EN5CB1_23980 [Tepidimicrobium xylanilyticum]SDW95537.1 serine/threonine protein kinase [Tepidimicrobium xylanilyticum]
MVIVGKWNKNRYKVIELIGKGSFGKVFKVLDDKGHIKAVKISKDLLSITNEYNSMIGLSVFSFVPKVYDFDDFVLQEKAYHFIVMDYIEGNNLKEIVSRSKLEPKRAFKIGKVLTDIMYVIYRLGYKYTDIKLDNIIIDGKGKLYFVDFGSLTRRDMPTKEYTPTYNIGSWGMENGDIKKSIFFSITMVMVSLIGGKEFNPLVLNLEEVIDKVQKFPLNRREKRLLIDGLKGKYVEFNEYLSSLNSLIEVKDNGLDKIDYLLIASIVSFVFVTIFGVKSILSW